MVGRKMMRQYRKPSSPGIGLVIVQNCNPNPPVARPPDLAGHGRSLGSIATVLTGELQRVSVVKI
jgi:hypothetical protein